MLTLWFYGGAAFTTSGRARRPSCVDGSRGERPDGVHFASADGARLATDRLAPLLRRLAIRAHDARTRAGGR
jgi:hypothetical protein